MGNVTLLPGPTGRSSLVCVTALLGWPYVPKGSRWEKHSLRNVKPLLSKGHFGLCVAAAFFFALVVERKSLSMEGIILGTICMLGHDKKEWSAKTALGAGDQGTSHYKGQTV